MLFDEFERDIAFACSGGMHDGRFAALLHHLHRRTVGFLIMFKQLQRHASHPQPQLRGIFHSNNGGYLHFDVIVLNLPIFYHESIEVAIETGKVAL